ncbi:hypothetical protein BOTBODRAFT_561526 [Botryobasidium botryosum FD-172 SS1]|uniref:Uncharacterized protein n=1 Tax=Botryobasidium botryosum (strain FD-172 SS1) TaxID=930990 RepID=A0A067M202_BOTB1|nr:hypothetical protein BOTBODRAFT_561526 [Botryobasidium botryosum FD-172 SS1]
MKSLGNWRPLLPALPHRALGMQTHLHVTPDESDIRVAIPVRDTPTISKNREMRREAQDRRRSSWGMRGRRASGSINGSTISQPHRTVPSQTFYKHISPEIPEPLRARHLLVWCSSRAMSPPSPNHTDRNKGAPPSPPLPALSPHASNLLKEMQDELIQMLAAGKIETNVWNSQTNGAESEAGRKKFKEHEQNIRNRNREREWGAAIERCKAEDEAWSDLIQGYNAQQEAVVSALAGGKTGKAHGKSRKDGEWMREMGEQWAKEVELARLEGERGGDGPTVGSAVGEDEEERDLADRLRSVETQLDVLHAGAYTTTQLAAHSASQLDTFFASLSSHLRSRSSVPARTGISATSTLLSVAHAGSSFQSTATSAEARDPIDLLRTLSRVDSAAKPEGESGEVKDTKVKERRVTAVGVPTPRRAPGTPSRRVTAPGTPGRRG